MRSVRSCHIFGRWPLHEKWKWNQKRDDHTQDKECAHEGKYTRLRIHHLLKLREGMPTGVRSTSPSENG